MQDILRIRAIQEDPLRMQSLLGWNRIVRVVFEPSACTEEKLYKGERACTQCVTNGA